MYYGGRDSTVIHEYTVHMQNSTPGQYFNDLQDYDVEEFTKGYPVKGYGSNASENTSKEISVPWTAPHNQTPATLDGAVHGALIP